MGVIKTEQDGKYRAVKANAEGKLPVVKVWDEASEKYVPVLSVTGGGVELPELENPGLAENLLVGTQLIDQEGNVVDGEMPVCGYPKIVSYTRPGLNAIELNVAMEKGYNDRERVSFTVKPAEHDPGLVPENIAYGASIFGVAGTYGKTAQVSLRNSISTSGQTVYVTYATSEETATTKTLDRYGTAGFGALIGSFFVVECTKVNCTFTVNNLAKVFEFKNANFPIIVVYQVVGESASVEIK